jgi:serine/threonine-protein kinase
MGKVYLARLAGSERPVVVKVMHPEIAAQPRFREGFQQEMQVMAQVRHPHIVELIDASSADPQEPYIVMEYLDGLPLDEILQQHSRLPVERVGRMLGQLCSALHFAHARGVIHRDLKPGNIMVLKPGGDDETIKVMDFGLAKIGHTVHLDLDKLKGSDITIARGTPEYMCPEQVRGDDMDHRGDIYSVGVILFELLTGHLPFVGRTVRETLLAHTREEAPRFAAVGAADVAPAAVETVVHHCLCKFPNERPQSARELAQRFGTALGQSILVEPEAGTAVAPAATPTPSKDPRQQDPLASVYQLEAYMPERIAVVKLRGYVEDAGGEIVDSVPGLVRVRLGGPRCLYRLPSPGFLASMFNRNAGQIDLELHMEKKNPSQAQLSITLVLRPADQRNGAKVVQTSAWQECCGRIYKDLRSYLMGKTG